jgi:hypothetical protein
MFCESPRRTRVSELLGMETMGTSSTGSKGTRRVQELKRVSRHASGWEYGCEDLRGGAPPLLTSEWKRVILNVSIPLITPLSSSEARCNRQVGIRGGESSGRGSSMLKDDHGVQLERSSTHMEVRNDKRMGRQRGPCSEF